MKLLSIIISVLIISGALLIVTSNYLNGSESESNNNQLLEECAAALEETTHLLFELDKENKELIIKLNELDRANKNKYIFISLTSEMSIEAGIGYYLPFNLSFHAIGGYNFATDSPFIGIGTSWRF